MVALDRILLATANAHKAAEIRAALADANLHLITLADLENPPPQPVEDRATFTANARLKALHYAALTGEPCLADDSGLVVEALDGAPGVLSARYAGASGSRQQIDAANNAKLVEALRDVPDDRRTARFICVMVLARRGLTIAQTCGYVEGRIIRDPRGSNGFGYDPHFFILEAGRTAAELAPDRKNALSHRGRAARRMLHVLRHLRRAP